MGDWMVWSMRFVPKVACTAPPKVIKGRIHARDLLCTLQNQFSKVWHNITLVVFPLCCEGTLHIVTQIWSEIHWYAKHTPLLKGLYVQHELS